LENAIENTPVISVVAKVYIIIVLLFLKK